MILSLGKQELSAYLMKQLDTFFPDGTAQKNWAGRDVAIAFDLALDRLEYCFQHIAGAAYSDDSGQTYFSHLHSDQLALFLCYFMISLWKQSQNKAVCDKVLVLNRCLHNMFVSYKCDLPDIVFFGHPVGTILGNAGYSDYLVVLQNVTVNTAVSKDQNPMPKLGKGLFLASGAQIIGDKRIGDRVSVGVNAVVYNQEIADDQVVTQSRQGGIVVRKRKGACAAQGYFRTSIV